MPNPILEVALPIHLNAVFDYLVPTNIDIDTSNFIGCRVRVSFRQRELVGICIATKRVSEIAIHKLKPITEAIDQQPCIPQELLLLCKWAANYYHYPLGEVLQTALPKRLREGLSEQAPKYWVHTTEGKGLPHSALARSRKQQALHQLLLERNAVYADDLKAAEISAATVKSLIQKGLIACKSGHPKHTQPLHIINQQGPALNEQQTSVLEQLRFHAFNCYLLEGITGSGKTEIYLQAIGRALQAGKQALVLIPEIGLTPQTIARFRQRFSVAVVELHSNVSEGEREQHWSAARDGRAAIIIGTRLASLCPVKNLGIIIIDEEHDNSYKQQDNFRYSARDLSIYRAKTLNIPIMLGSATPSLESLNNALTGRYQHLKLTKRAGNAKPPALKLVDLKTQSLRAGLCNEALSNIKATLDAGQQAMVFVNRRGFAPALICHQCGWTADCPSCDAKMTLHTTPRHLRCHYCDRQRPVPFQCPSCNHRDLNHQGLGTEQIEQTLRQLFPAHPILRIDRDSTSRKNAFADALNTLHTGAPCIVVGTQMLAKGHHLPSVTLVIIVNADQGLCSADFRGTEKLGQLIVQVAGRAGREENPGTVLIQSHKPEHPLLETLISQGYHRFARALINERRATHLPPFSQVVMFRAESKRAENAIELLELARTIAQKYEPASLEVQYLGPYPSQMERVQDRFRYQLQIKSADRRRLNRLLKNILTELPDNAIAKRTRWSLDVDAME